MASKIDKFISNVFPSWGFNRAVSRHNTKILNSTLGGGGYDGGKYGRNRSVPLNSRASEDIAAGHTYHNMIANAMSLYRNEPMCKSTVDVSDTYMGESRPTATTSDKEWNKLATDYFNNVWWHEADARGRMGGDYGELQHLFENWSWFGGDMLFVPFEGGLIPYEGTQIQTPSKLRSDKQIINGVRFEATAPHRPTHYYLVEGNNYNGDYKRIAADEAIFAGARNWRPSMVRSVPDLHGVIDAMHSFGKTNTDVQKRIEFEAMLFTVEKNGAISGGGASKFLTSANGASGGLETTKSDWGMRLKVNGDVDKDFRLEQMKNPSSNYVNVMEHMGRWITAGTGFPYEVVAHLYTNGSYTANRAARLDFAKALMKRWAWRNKVLNQRVYNWKIAEAMDKGILPLAPVDAKTGLSEWNKCTWSLPHFPHIDEGKEVVADVKQWGCGQESIADWAQQKGQTRDQFLDAHDVDIEEMQARADTLGIPLSQYAPQLFTASAEPQIEENKGDANNE